MGNPHQRAIHPDCIHHNRLHPAFLLRARKKPCRKPARLQGAGRPAKAMVLVGLSVPPLKKFCCAYYTIPRQKCKASLQQKNQFVKSDKKPKSTAANFVRPKKPKRKPPTVAGSLMAYGKSASRFFTAALIVVFLKKRNEL
jgi:hypothetical protein